MANDEIRPRRVRIRPAIPGQRRQAALDLASVDRLLEFPREVQAQIDELVAETGSRDESQLPGPS